MYLHASDDRPEDRDGFRFRGGHVALDLAATLGGRLKTEPRELLATPADLDRWLVSAGLVERKPGANEHDLELARELREAIYAIASGRSAGGARERLNEVAALPAAAPRLMASGGLTLDGDARALLATIAREAVELFGGLDRTRIRICEGEGCAILFLDLSRAGGRRWCSMSGCGNRAKARAFRERNMSPRT
jgi:predicted RNA-binding Zn ribbon-like protein